MTFGGAPFRQAPNYSAACLEERLLFHAAVRRGEAHLGEHGIQVLLDVVAHVISRHGRCAGNFQDADRAARVLLAPRRARRDREAQSIFAPERRTTSAQRGVSRRTSARNSSGVLPSISLSSCA